MADALITKLENFTRLSHDDRSAVTRLCDGRVRVFAPGEDVAREGDATRFINVVIEGWAWRYKVLEDGRRQVTSLFLPGDICDLYIFVLREMDHFIGAVTDVTIAQVSRDLFDEVTLGNPRVLQALLWDTVVSVSIQREWTVNLGQRTAYERIAHLFCETYIRLRAAGRVSDGSCDWPLTQMQLADAAGLSAVHVNRTIQDLRDNGLIALRGRKLTIPDLEALKVAALFDPNYLHLDHEGQHLDANEP
jgi:CRP-like cAMP-binding protein